MAKKRKADAAVDVYESPPAANAALERLGTVRGVIATFEAEREEKIRETRTYYGSRIELMQEEERELLEALEASAVAHPEWIPAGRRSVDLPHGRIGWREAVSIKLKRTVEHVLAALHERKLAPAIIVKEAVNKDVLATYSDDTLEAVGAKRVRKDEFFVTLAETK